MATIDISKVLTHGRMTVTWADLTNDDDGSPYEPPVGYRLASMQFTGTLGTGPTLTIQGSNEATATNYGSLGTATALGVISPTGYTRHYRPLVDGGSGTTVTAVATFIEGN